LPSCFLSNRKRIFGIGITGFGWESGGIGHAASLFQTQIIKVYVESNTVNNTKETFIQEGNAGKWIVKCALGVL
jgi:hypothetical protein